MRAFATIVLGLTLLAVSGIDSQGQEYSFGVKYHTAYGDNMVGPNLLLAAVPGWTDGDDGFAFDTPMDLSAAAYPCSVAAIHKTNGLDGWDGSTGYYWGDTRGPLPAGGTKTFDNIYFWAMPGTPAGSIVFSAADTYISLSLGVTYELSLVSIPQGITYGGPREWMMRSSGVPPAVVLPYYATEDPSTGYKFRAEVTAIPEPSSLLAFACGLAGIGVWTRRRRG